MIFWACFFFVFLFSFNKYFFFRLLFWWFWVVVFGGVGGAQETLVLYLTASSVSEIKIMMSRASEKD